MEDTVGIDSQVACLVDGLTDDYEHLDEELPGMPCKDKSAL